MIQDFFLHSCDIYRLQGFSNQDFTDSSEGEVSDTWGIVSLNSPCRFEFEDGAFSRRSDGVADVGTHKVYMGPEVDIQNADRLYRAIGENGSDFFEVTAVSYIRDVYNTLHHKEVSLSHIDWTTPTSATNLWIPEPLPATIMVYDQTFDYRSTFPMTICDVVAGNRIKVVIVQVDNPFNDLAAYVTVGYDDVVDNLISADEPDLGSENIHEEIENILLLSDTAIKVYGDLGTSTQGSGIVFVEVIV